MRLPLLLILILFACCARERNIPASTQESEPTSQAITGQTDSAASAELIGIWQDSPEIASGYSDHYIFYSNGNFSFNYNQMVCDNRTIRYSGTWTLRRNTLQLTASDKTVIVGGKLVPTGEAGSCASDYYIEGGEKKTIAFQDVQTLQLSDITIDSVKYDFKRRTFNEKPFWRIEDEPTDR